MKLRNLILINIGVIIFVLSFFIYLFNLFGLGIYWFMINILGILFCGIGLSLENIAKKSK